MVSSVAAFEELGSIKPSKRRRRPSQRRGCRKVRFTHVEKAFLLPYLVLAPQSDDEEALELELNTILETGMFPSELAAEEAKLNQREVLSLDDSKENSVREGQRDPHTPSQKGAKKANDSDFAFSTPIASAKTPRRSGVVRAQLPRL